MIRDPHIAWSALYRSAVDRYNETEDEAAFALSMDLQSLISRTPASSLAGVREQLLLLCADLRPAADPVLDSHAALLNAIAAVERMTVT
jgi:hypothetical protein